MCTTLTETGCCAATRPVRRCTCRAGAEIRKPVNGPATGTRYYAVGGTTVAVRTPAGVTWLVSDHHGTGSATVSDDGKGTVTRRRTLPFGNDRGTSPSTWAGDKGFVGGTRDNNGLTHLGACEYDPALGRFISVDPLMDMTVPAQWNGYGYADDNPVGLSDPLSARRPARQRR
jgi:RHS repeat-associated protein